MSSDRRHFELKDEESSVEAVLKVYDSLRDLGLDSDKIMECVRKMHEAGIIFREKVKKTVITRGEAMWAEKAREKGVRGG